MLCRTRGIDTISQYDFYDSLVAFCHQKNTQNNSSSKWHKKVCEFMARNGNFEGHYAVQWLKIVNLLAI